MEQNDQEINPCIVNELLETLRLYSADRMVSLINSIEKTKDACRRMKLRPLSYAI